MTQYRIRLADPSDARAILDIYSPYILHTNITFEETVPSIDSFAERMRGVMAKYPYLVCCRDEKVIGYAYAGPYRSRASYRWGAELSVYLSPDAQGCGMGTLLYETVMEFLRIQGYQKAYGCITYPNEKSRRMHEALGFSECARFHRTGYKNGQWLDVFWMEKMLGDFPDIPTDPVSFPQLDAETVQNVLSAANRKITEHTDGEK